MASLIVAGIIVAVILFAVLLSRTGATSERASLPFATPFATSTSRDGFILDECFAQDVNAVMYSTLFNRDKGHGRLYARKDGISFKSEKQRGETFNSRGYDGLHTFVEQAPGIGCFLVLRSRAFYEMRFQLGKTAAANMVTIINHMREQEFQGPT